MPGEPAAGAGDRPDGRGWYEEAMTSDAASARPDPTDEVVDLCRDLIRIDTTNTGDNATSAGERAAAEYVAEKLAEVGLDAEIHESAPGPGQRGRPDPGRRPAAADALLVHGHLDVVPADADEWSVHPFAGEIRDGYLWGRGAIDMKDFDAMVLAVVRRLAAHRRTPAARHRAGVHRRRGGRRRLRRALPGRATTADLFEGCTEAIGEVGGFSVHGRRRPAALPDRDRREGHRLAAAARHGPARARLDDPRRQRGHRARRGGRPGRPAPLPGRGHRRPCGRSSSEVSDALGIELDPDDPEAAIAKLGPIAQIIGATLRNTANPTRLAAGYKDNVIPGRATATIDCRTLPGQSELSSSSSCASVVGPDIEIEYIQRQPALETTFDGDLVDAMAAALRAEDPGARPVPYMLSGGTDAKAFARLGIRCFGFAPLRLPADLNFSGAVPRHRRAGAGGRTTVRRAGARPVPPHLLSVPPVAGPRPIVKGLPHDRPAR